MPQHRGNPSLHCAALQQARRAAFWWLGAPAPPQMQAPDCTAVPSPHRHTPTPGAVRAVPLLPQLLDGTIIAHLAAAGSPPPVSGLAGHLRPCMPTTDWGMYYTVSVTCDTGGALTAPAPPLGTWPTCHATYLRVGAILPRPFATGCQLSVAGAPGLPPAAATPARAVAWRSCCGPVGSVV